jgi:hypothetical protein
MEPFDLLGALGVQSLIILKDGRAFVGALSENADGTYTLPSSQPRMRGIAVNAEDIEAVKPL